MAKAATSGKSSGRTHAKPTSTQPHSSDPQKSKTATSSGHHSTKTHSKQSTSTQPHSSDPQKSKTPTSSGHHSTKTHSKQSTSTQPHSSDPQKSKTATSSGHHSFDLSSYLFKQSELQVVHKKKVDSAKTSKATEDSSANVKKGYAQSKVDKVMHFFSVKSNKLYCVFLQGAIPLFEHANVALQKEEPCIHIMHRTLLKQLREILVRFIKPEFLINDITKVDFTNTSSHKSSQGLFIGNAARDLITTMPDLDLTTFYVNVKNFYMAATKYMLKKFPYGDELLLHAEVVDPKLKMTKDFSSLRYFTDRFPVVLQQHDTGSLDELEGQFLNFQVDANDEKFERVDVFWSNMLAVRDENGQKKYHLLAGVMLGILTIFHSNADSERIFSVVTKNKCKFRPNLSTRVLGSIITHKMCLQSSDQVCHTATVSKDTLKKAKQATTAMLKASQ